MSKAEGILEELRRLGNEGTAKVLLKHGARQPCYGVKIEALKAIQKRVKTDHDLAMELFASGVFDAMYLAGLVMDGGTMTKKELQGWVDTAYGSSISSYTVPWVASESEFGTELALKWIASGKEFVAVSGWATLSAIVSITPDGDLDLERLKALAGEVVKGIGKAPNRVKQAMNNFLISLGSSVAPLTDAALKAAIGIGTVKVDVGDTECKIPDAVAYIGKVKSKGGIGKKKKTAKC